MVLCSLVVQAETTTPLKVFVLKDSPSMSYRDDKGELAGFNVDLARLLCEKIQKVCSIQETTLVAVIDQVSRGEADFSTAALAPTPERQKKVLFTEPVLHSKSFWFAKKKIGDADNFRVAVVAGSTQYQWATRNAGAHQWTVVPVESNAAVSTAMLEGRAEAGVSPFASVLNFAHEGKLSAAGFTTLQALDDDTVSLHAAVAVNPNNKDLLEALNKAIREIKLNGQLDELNSKHFPMRML